jgi:hypothetical protein
MTGRRLTRFGLSAGLAASLSLAGCKRAVQPPPPELPAPPTKQELPVEQTPVKSLYEEKPGVLYEQPARTPTVTKAPVSTPSPSPAARR